MRIAILVLITVLLPAMCSPIPAQDEELRRGLSLWKAGQLSEAEGVLSRITPDQSAYASAQACLGLLLLKRAALSPAENSFRNALERNPGEASARLGLGTVLLLRGEPAAAGKEFDKVLADENVGLNANIQKVWSLFMAGGTEAALEEIHKLVAKHPGDPEARRLQGFLYQVHGDSERSLKSYLECIRLDPVNRQAISCLIAIYRAQKDWEMALRWARYSLMLDANQPVLCQELAEILDRLGRSEEAKTAREEAVRTYDAELLFARSVRAKSMGNREDAENQLRDSIARNPHLPKAWVELGELLQSDGRFVDAIQAFRNALEVAERDERAVLGLVTSLLSLGRDAEAVRYFERDVAEEEPSPDLLMAIAAAFLKQGRTVDALASALRANIRLPDHPALLSYLGYLQQWSGRAQQALLSYEASLRFNPGESMALFGKAQLLSAGQEAQSAIDSLRAALELDPGNVRIWKGSIEVYRDAGRPDSAEFSCRKCLQIDPHDPECREHLADLRLAAGNFAGAAEQYKILFDSGIRSKSTLDGFAYALMKTGALGSAIEMSKASLKRYGPDARVYTTLGFLYRCTNNLPAAVSYYRLARDRMPGNADTQEDLGYALYLTGNFTAALTPLESALRLRPNWGAGAYNLAMVYWQLGMVQPALQHARRAQELGVQEAVPVVRSLTAAGRVPAVVTIRRTR